MASDIDICNLALLRLGTRSSISSLTEGSTEANACALVYPIVRDALLTTHKWGFATRRVSLADLGSPPDGWGFRYAYPTDCLQARYIRQTPGGAAAVMPSGGGAVMSSGGAGEPFIPFEVSGDVDGSGTPCQVILTDQPQAELVYTARIGSAALFDATFVEAMSWSMAAELAMTLTGDKGIAQGCMQSAADTVNAAKANDANEAPEIRDRPAEWVAGRGHAWRHGWGNTP